MRASASGDSFVGVLSRRGRFMVAEPLFERERRVTVDVRGRIDVSAGDMALVRARRGGRPQVVRALGRPEVAADVVEALLLDRKHARRFDARVEEEATNSARAPDVLPRRDLTLLPTFTIDPAEARDFDDAVSAEADGDGLLIYVHIADVAAHVAAETWTDLEARRRGNSVYVPGTVEPMLPEALSNEACSLVPGIPRRAVTVEMRIDSRGDFVASSFYRSLIRSDARLTYDQAERIFEGREQVPDKVIADPLRRARAFARDLRHKRLARGALGVETSEPEFEFDEDGHVVRATDAVQTESHNVIEELMILANEQVAQTLSQRQLPTLYRVHEEPEPAAIEFLAEQLESLDIPTPPIPDHITPRAAGELAGAIGAAVEEHLQRGGGRAALTSLVLRSLKQAYYSPSNVGHAGLASAAYTHFTSPIRRYPDLVVHRALLAAIGAGEDPPHAHDLNEVGWHCSQTEREAMQVEREADDICLAFLLEHDLFEHGWDRRFEGEVSGLVPAGAFVSFTLGGDHAAACEGFLPARKLRGEYFELNEERTALVGRRTGRRLRLGDPVEVSVRGVEPPRGRIDLAPADVETSPDEQRERRRGTRSGPHNER